MEAFALALNLDEHFFKGFTDKHASAIRALNYPVMDNSYCTSGHVRASAHTDYGTLTILKSGNSLYIEFSTCVLTSFCILYLPGGSGLQAAKDTEPPVW